MMPISLGHISVPLLALLFAVTQNHAATEGVSPQEAKWIEIKQPAHGFSAMFPKAPKINPLSSDDSSLSVYEYMAVSESGVYSIAVSEYPLNDPPAADEESYTETINDCAKASSTNIRTRKSATIDGHKAVEAVLENAKHTSVYLLDVVIVRNRIYLLSSGGHAGHENSSDAIRFRDSFRILSK